MTTPSAIITATSDRASRRNRRELTQQKERRESADAVPEHVERGSRRGDLRATPSTKRPPGKESQHDGVDPAKPQCQSWPSQRTESPHEDQYQPQCGERLAVAPPRPTVTGHQRPGDEQRGSPRQQPRPQTVGLLLAARASFDRFRRCEARGAVPDSSTRRRSRRSSRFSRRDMITMPD